MNFIKDSVRLNADAALAVVAIGWISNAAGLNLAAAGVDTDRRGFVKVDEFMRTSAAHIYAAGDITGGLMLVPQATQSAFVAATNAAGNASMKYENRASPIGSFTDPEYAQVGMTEAQASEGGRAIVKADIRFDTTARTIIDGHTMGFCKLIVDRASSRILGCHVVGERAVEITQVASIAIASGMKVDDLAQVPLSFPTYAGILVRVAAKAAHQLNLKLTWVANESERA